MHIPLVLALLVSWVVWIPQPVMAGDAKVFVNSRGVVHKGSQGVTEAFPDIATTPPSDGPVGVPIPYPNIAEDEDTTQGAKDVKVDGNTVKPPDMEATEPQEGILSNSGPEDKVLRPSPKSYAPR